MVADMPVGSDVWQWGIGLDFGYNHWTSGIMGVVSPDDVMYIAGEHFLRQGTVSENAQTLMAWKQFR
jgi:hypothetical protein